MNLTPFITPESIRAHAITYRPRHVSHDANIDIPTLVEAPDSTAQVTVRTLKSGGEALFKLMPDQVVVALRVPIDRFEDLEHTP